MDDEKPRKWPSIKRMKAYYASQAYKKAAKLTPTERCQAFACLCLGMRPSLVQEMFDLSESSVSYLKGRVPVPDEALIEEAGFTKESLGLAGRARDPDRKLRYQDVVDEYDRLGEKVFMDQYFFVEGMLEREEAAKKRLNADKKSKLTHFPT